MITRETFIRLNGLKGDGHYVVSVYLHVDPVASPRGEYFVVFRNRIREELEKIPSGAKLLSADIQRIEGYLKGGKKEFKKGLVIFASDAVDLWEVHHLSVPLKNHVVVDKTPYLKPLANFLEAHPSDLIVLVDREHARMLKVSQGEVLEYDELTAEDVPGKHRRGGWYGRDENRFRRHTKSLVALHLKDVVREIEDQCSTGDIGRIVLGGTEESLAVFRKMFSQAMNDRVVGTFHAEIRASTEDILKRAGEVTRRVERVQQDQWVEELLNRVEKDGSASVGLEAVLQSLQEGKIHRLIYREDFRSEGFRCPSCGFLSVQGAGGCPYCKSEMERVEHMMDYAVQRVLDQGAHVCAVADDVRLQAVGSIGAILRY